MLIEKFFPFNCKYLKRCYVLSNSFIVNRKKMSTGVVKITKLLKSETPTFSVEVTPEIEKWKLHKFSFEPTFFCVTWHAKSYDFKDFEVPPIKLAKYLRSQGKIVCLHLACDLLKRDYLNGLLIYLQEIGICNLFIVLGESYDYINSDFKFSKELIAYIRRQSGNYFCIGVAGFPACSDNAILLLRQKIEVGADFIITQAFFEPLSYNNFVVRCVKAGMNVPVIPGLFVYQTKKELEGFSNLCKIKIPSEVLDTERYGLESMTTLVQNLNKSSWRHFHFFTLNKLDLVSTFVQQLNQIFKDEDGEQGWGKTLTEQLNYKTLVPR